MRSLFLSAALMVSTAASATPLGPVTLVGEYCGFGPCLPLTARLDANSSCSVDFIGEGRWKYDKKRQELWIYADSVVVLSLSLSLDDRCGSGLVNLEPSGLPSSNIEMCVF